jgi:hypothetical protein
MLGNFLKFTGYFGGIVLGTYGAYQIRYTLSGEKAAYQRFVSELQKLENNPKPTRNDEAYVFSLREDLSSRDYNNTYDEWDRVFDLTYQKIYSKK